MPGHSKSAHWTSVDFDSEEEGDQSSNQKSQRIYMDPWDLDNYTFVRRSLNGEAGPVPAEQMGSFAGEPVSASFYYVPTKSYESEEEEPAPYRRRSVVVPATVDLAPEYEARAGERRKSKMYFDEHLNEMPNAGYDSVHYERRPSRQHPDELYYQQHGPEAYGPPQRAQAPGAAYVAAPRRRSVASHAEYAPPQMKHDRMSVQGRYPDSFDRHAPYESITADYSMDEWERNSDLPVKPPPENFHFSRYGHLKIDYSCSWTSLDRLIRNQ